MTLDRAKLAQGQFKAQVGMVKGKPLRFLAQVGVCNKDTCPIKDLCPYKTKGRCIYVYNFLISLFEDWVHPVHGLGDVLSQDQLDRIGLHLMPLYHQLIRFQLETRGLEETSYETKTGVKNEYPQFRSIREVNREIRAERKDLQLDKVWKQKFGEERPLPSPAGSLDDMRDGRPGAYEAMVKRAKKVKEK